MDENELNLRLKNFRLRLIGEGSYANVYKYKDDFYNCYFALKRIKRNSDRKEHERFKHEFELLSNYNHPNIMKVYRYLEEQNAYIMEYCDFTLKKYIDENGNKILLNERKDIALQFLRAIKVIHDKDVLHRDISYNNILIKMYDTIPIVKISDFGLAKDRNLDLTLTGSTIKGTIIDDTLESFKEYNLKNEIYAIGVILYFIFTGKQNLNFRKDYSISKIVKKCVERNHDDRYNSVDEIILDVSNITENKKENKLRKFNIELYRNSINNNGLSELAIEILRNAAEDGGEILWLKTITGPIIKSGNNNYTPASHREEAELENAIETLERNGYIKATSYKREIFKVTKEGYDYYDSQIIYV